MSKSASPKPDFETISDLIAQAHLNSKPDIYSGRSHLWNEIIGQRPDLPSKQQFDRFLDCESDFCYGMGANGGDLDYHRKQHDEYFSRYGDQFSAADLQEWPEPPVGSPTQLPCHGSQCSAYYIPTLGTTLYVRRLLEKYLGRSNNLSMLEIGAGYGSKAELLIRMGVVSSYADVDLPENLLISAGYISQCHPGMGLKVCDSSRPDSFSPNALRFAVPDDIVNITDKFDVIFNASSLGEMPAETAHAYIRWVYDHLSEDGIFITFNGIRRSPDAVQSYSEYGLGDFGLLGIFGNPASAYIEHDQYGILVLSRERGRKMPEGLPDDLDPLYGLGLHSEITALFGNVEDDTDLEVKQTAIRSVLNRTKKSSDFPSGSPLAAIALQIEACHDYLVWNRVATVREYFKDGKSVLARAIAYAILLAEGEDPDPRGLPPHLQSDARKRSRKRIRNRISMFLRPNLFERIVSSARLHIASLT